MIRILGKHACGTTNIDVLRTIQTKLEVVNYISTISISTQTLHISTSIDITFEADGI